MDCGETAVGVHLEFMQFIQLSSFSKSKGTKYIIILSCLWPRAEKRRHYSFLKQISNVLFYQKNSNVLRKTKVCLLEMSESVKLKLAPFHVVHLANF